MCNAERASAMQFDSDAYVQRIAAKVIANPEGMLVLDSTVFYPAGGGQPGDTGVIELADGRRIHIIDTRRAPGNPGVILHAAAGTHNGCRRDTMSSWRSTGIADTGTCACTPVCTFSALWSMHR